MCAKMSTYKPLILVHGGAGFVADETAARKIEGMKTAVKSALPFLESGSKTPALDAVEAAVKSMELDEHFNAGYGACLNIEGKVEVEASIMDGNKLRAGCVTLLHDILHPISVARRIMDTTPHTFLGGTSAQKFAIKEGFAQLAEGSLETEKARVSLAKYKAQGLKLGTGETGENAGSTVGAVAIDCQGNVAVATSTGGLTGKLPGRIGDTPILGCGSYADNEVGCVSTTGNGEVIMRYNLAQRILSLIRFKNITAQEATELACKDMTKQLEGTGGAITIDNQGNFGIYWTSPHMGFAYAQDEHIFSGINHGELFKEPL